MRFCVLVLLSLPGVAVAQSAKPSPTRAEAPSPADTDLTTLSGRTYKNAKAYHVEPDGITYMFAGGMVKIPFNDLPEAIRKQYDYDSTRATAFEQQDEAVQAETYRATQAQLAAAARQSQAALEVAAQHSTNDTYHHRNDAPLPGEPTAAIDPNWQGGLKTLAKLSVGQVSASPFSLKGVLVEMHGIDRVEPKEISAGVYRLTIWSHEGDYLEGILPAAQAQIAEQSKRLFVAVKDPDCTPVQITIFGNATTYQGLSTLPTVIWR